MQKELKNKRGRECKRKGKGRGRKEEKGIKRDVEWEMRTEREGGRHGEGGRNGGEGQREKGVTERGGWGVNREREKAEEESFV